MKVSSELICPLSQFCLPLSGIYSFPEFKQLFGTIDGLDPQHKKQCLFLVNIQKSTSHQLEGIHLTTKLQFHRAVPKLQSFFKPSSGAYLFLLLYTSKEMLGVLWPSMHATTTEATSTQETLPLPRSPEYNEREQATQRNSPSIQFHSLEPGLASRPKAYVQQ